VDDPSRRDCLRGGAAKDRLHHGSSGSTPGLAGCPRGPETNASPARRAEAGCRQGEVFVG
jgi:hypothetical protein